jgi:molybdate transport system permease protein
MRMRRAARGSGGVSRLLTVLGGAGALFLVLPLVGLLLRTPWARIGELASDPGVRSALQISLLASLGALAVSTLVGVPLAWLLARREFPGRSLLRALCVLPMVLPPVVGGVGLLTAFGRRGFVGGPLAELTGISLPFTFAGVVLAGAFVAMPFLIITVEAGLRGMDRRHEEAAATLGATRAVVLRRVTLPLIAPSLAAGMALCWARALGEFGATITFAGNLSGRTQTMPLAVYVTLESDPAAAILLSFVLLAVSIVVLVVLRGHFLGTR